MSHDERIDPATAPPGQQLAQLHLRNAISLSVPEMRSGPQWLIRRRHWEVALMALMRMEAL